MKKILIFPCTILRPFLVSLPMAFVLVLSILLNHAVDTLLKLYPLIAVSSLGIVFTFVFFFRIIVVTYDEIKFIGPFSSRDRAVINEGKKIIFTTKKRGRIKIDLYGNDGKNAELDWLKGQTVINDTYLFKGLALGGKRQLKKALAFFDVPNSDVGLVLSDTPFEKEYEDYSLSSHLVNGEREVSLLFKRTL